MSKTNLISEVLIAENNYKNIVSKEHRKEFGQFFTPTIVANWMADWVLKNNPQEILEPSMGIGSLVAAVLNKNDKAKIIGIEKDAELVKQIPSKLKQKISLNPIDYFAFATSKKFDAIISNPPYVRHHSLTISDDIYGRIESIAGEHISKTTNLYILFCIDLIDRLKPNGRAAIIIPTEWMNANFGLSFKKYLFKKGILESIIYVSHDALVFDDALTTASILLIENKKKLNKEVKFEFVLEREFFEKKDSQKKSYKSFSFNWERLLNTKKWDSLFYQNRLEGTQKNLIKLETLCKSKRGIATGANEFFHISQKIVQSYNLSKDSLKFCIGSAVDVRGLIFGEADLKQLISAERNIYLFDPETIGESEYRYIQYGKTKEFDKRYLTANRKIWYQQEKRNPSQIWVGVFNRDRIKFIYNECGAYNLTTFHCLYPLASLTNHQITALVAILNHQDMRAYVMEQRRVYGGGLIKFEPKDLNDIRVPDVRLLPQSLITQIVDELKIADLCEREGRYYEFQFDLHHIFDISPPLENGSMFQQALI